MTGRLDVAPGKQGLEVRRVRDTCGGTGVTYFDFRPLESEVVLGVSVWVRVEARAEEE